MASPASELLPPELPPLLLLLLLELLELALLPPLPVLELELLLLLLLLLEEVFDVALPPSVLLRSPPMGMFIGVGMLPS